jgi:hypothetical protein
MKLQIQVGLFQELPVTLWEVGTRNSITKDNWRENAREISIFFGCKTPEKSTPSPREHCCWEISKIPGDKRLVRGIIGSPILILGFRAEAKKP